MNSIQEINEVQAKSFASYAHKILAKKCDLKAAQVSKSLAFLMDVKQVEDSFGELLKKSPEYDDMSQAAKTNKQTLPEPHKVLDDIIASIVSGGFDASWRLHPDALDLRLATSDEPLATNGEWDNEAKRVIWRRSINAGDGLPTLCYAAWCEPDVAAQEKYFGRVVLRGDQLAEYVGLYSMLDAKAQSELDQFIASLDPSDDKSKVYAYAYKLRNGNPLLRKIGSILASAIEKNQPGDPTLH
jgi:hypothetical protein